MDGPEHSSGLTGVGRAGLAAAGAVGLIVVGASFVLPWVEKGDENGANLLWLPQQPVSLLLMTLAVGLWIAWLIGLVGDPWRSQGAGMAGSVLAMVTLALSWTYAELWDTGSDGSAEMRLGAHVALVGAVLLTATTAFHVAACARHRAGRAFAGIPPGAVGARVASLPGLVAVAAAFTLDWASLRNDGDRLFHTVAPGRGGVLFHVVVAAMVLAAVLGVLWLVLPARRWPPAVGLVGSVLGLAAVAALWCGIAAADAGWYGNADGTKGEYGAFALWYGWCWVLACIGAEAAGRARPELRTPVVSRW